MAASNFFKHWPTVLLGLVVATVLVLAIVTYQIKETECAVITTLGRVENYSPTPGLHFRWPYPFQRIHTFDRRTRSFWGKAGRLEETITADGQNVIIGIYVNYRIDDARKFFVTMEKITEAENQMNNWMRDSRNATFGRYKFNQIINTDPAKMKLAEIQENIKKELIARAENFGIEIQSVGINTINVPETITEDVFNRMIADRKRVAKEYLAAGTTKAATIRTEANKNRDEILTNAEALAKAIRAQGDSEAAQYYSVFKENPELAVFLRKLDSLRRIMKGRTTLVLDTSAAPFDLLNPGADILKPVGPVAK
jgi:membrane protease subunit HflC